MLSFLLISCMKSIVIDTRPPVQPTVQLVLPPESSVDALDATVKIDLGPTQPERERRYLSYPQKDPKISTVLSNTDPLPLLEVTQPSGEAIPAGESLWWSFSQAIRPQSLEVEIPNWTWIWHSPSLLELKPESPFSSSLNIPKINLYSETGQSLTLEESLWTIHPLIIEDTHLFETDARLELCLKYPVSLKYAPKTFYIEDWNGLASESVTLLPSDTEFSSHCDGLPSMGIQFDKDDSRLIERQTGHMIYQAPQTTKNIEISCSETPCLPQSPIVITGLPQDEITLHTNRKWSDIQYQYDSVQLRIHAHKPRGEHRIQIKHNETIVDSVIDVVDASAQLELPKRTLRPDNGRVTLKAEGQWRYTLYPAQPEDWQVFLESPTHRPLTPPIQVRTQSAADGQLLMELPKTDQNYIVHFSAGSEQQSAWILPDQLHVDHLSHADQAVLLISNHDGPISEASLHHSSGLLQSNDLGEIKATANKMTESDYVSWKGLWHPIIHQRKPVIPSDDTQWSVFLTQHSVQARETLKAYGWAPKPNTPVKWSIASTEKIDILKGQAISGLYSELDIQVPIPSTLPAAEYQLHITQDSLSTTLYFSVHNASEPPRVSLSRTLEHLRVQAHSNTAQQYITLEAKSEQHTDPHWDELGTFWLPHTGTIDISGLDDRYRKLKIALADINRVQTHEEILSIPQYDTRYALTPSAAVYTVHDQIKIELTSTEAKASMQTWQVEYEGQTLCSASIHEACTFKAPATGKIKLLAAVEDHLVNEVEVFVLSKNSPQATVIPDQNHLFLQARSPKATALLYIRTTAGWTSELLTSTTGYFTYPIPPHSLSLVAYIWDSKGRTAHHSTLNLDASFKSFIQDDQLKAIGTIPRSGLILIDITKAQQPRALGPVKTGQDGSVRWELPTESRIQAVEIYTPTEIHHPILHISPRRSAQDFQAPQSLRLDEVAYAELTLHNFFERPQRFHYQLEPSTGLGTSMSQSGSLTLEPQSTVLIPLKLKAQTYGQHGLKLHVHNDLSEKVLQHTITINPSSDDTRTAQEHYVDVFDQGRYVEHALTADKSAFIATDIQPTLALVNAVRPFFDAPPSLRSKYQLVWIGNALWDSLAHARNPDRLRILDTISQHVLEPATARDPADRLLWDLALLQSAHNGVTPSMMNMLNRLEALPYEFDSNLPVHVQDTLECLQYWAIALAQSSLYKGVSPELPASWNDLHARKRWKDFPVMAQSLLLQSAHLLKDRALKRDIIQYWEQASDRLNEPLPESIAAYFHWSASASLDSVRWALAHSAPRSPLLRQLGTRTSIPNGDMWAVLAAAAQATTKDSNLKTALLEEKYLVKDGRYHPYRTQPIFHQKWVSAPTQWQLLIFGQGRQYYTIGHYSKGQHESFVGQARLKLMVRTEHEFVPFSDEVHFEQHQHIDLKLEAAGLQARSTYWLYWPEISGFEASELKVHGGKILAQNGPWTHVQADQAEMALYRSVSPTFAGQVRIPPFRWYRHAHINLAAQTQSHEWQIKSEGEYHLEQPPAE